MTNNANVPLGARMGLSFAYDYQGRRISKTVVVSGVTNTLLHFIYDGWNLIGQLNGSNNALIASYYWGPDLSGTMHGAGGVGGLLWETTYGSGTTTDSYAAHDANGNIVAPEADS